MEIFVGYLIHIRFLINYSDMNCEVLTELILYNLYSTYLPILALPFIPKRAYSYK